MNVELRIIEEYINDYIFMASNVCHILYATHRSENSRFASLGARKAPAEPTTDTRAAMPSTCRTPCETVETC